MPNHSVNPEEIAKFSELDWWDPQGPMRPLHGLNPARLAYIQKQAVLKRKKTLDVGCGGGILSESLYQAGADLIAIDANPKVIEIAKNHAQLKRLPIDYRCTSIEDFFTEQSERFDVISCMELLEHVDDPVAFIQYLSQLLKPGGQIFFSTINRTFKAYVGSIFAAEYLFNLLPKGTHNYDLFITPAELTAWCRKAHLSIQHIQGLSYNPFTNQAHLTPDPTINYLAFFTKEA